MFTHAAGTMATRSFMLKLLLMELRILLVVRILGDLSGQMKGQRQPLTTSRKALITKCMRMMAIRTHGIGTGSVEARLHTREP